MSVSVLKGLGRRLSRLGMIGVAIAIPLMSERAGAQPSSVVAPGATVDELLALVRQFNPDLAAAVLESEAAVAKIYPAGALDDPMLNVTRDQGFRQTMVTVSQEFSLWGKRGLRRDEARANADVAKAQRGTVLQDLQEQVKITFAQYYAAENALRVIHEIHTLLDNVVESTRTRYAQGTGTQADVIRASVEQTRLELELSNLERDEEVAKAKINALIARPADSALATPAALRRVPASGSLVLSQLLARARDINPMLAGARAQILAAEDERQLVHKSWYPDITLSVGADKLPTMSTQPVVGVGIKIPLQWGVRRAQAQAADAQKAAAQTRLSGTLLKLESDLQSQLANLNRAKRTADVLTNTLIQQSESAYSSALATYQTGRSDLSAVLDTLHQQLQVRLDVLQAQTDEQSAFASIERLVGGEL
jgi:cobalt-zinc-cadmium efflux system outer membrane protein